MSNNIVLNRRERHYVLAFTWFGRRYVMGRDSGKWFAFSIKAH